MNDIAKNPKGWHCKMETKLHRQLSTRHFIAMYWRLQREREKKRARDRGFRNSKGENSNILSTFKI